MSALGDTVGNFRALGAAVARLFADVLDGPDPCGHDVDLPVTDLGPFECYAETGESSRAEGTQRAQTPGEESADPSPDPAPSPGDYPHPSAAELADLPDSTLLNEFSAALLKAGRRARLLVDQLHLFNLADAARDRAAQLTVAESEPECPRDAYYCGDCGVLNLVPHLSISHDDLAAHVTASLHRAITACLDTPLGIPTRTPSSPEVADAVASSLLDDFDITKK